MQFSIFFNFQFFLFVTVACGNEELRMMVQERWASPHVPVLVMSLVPTETSQRIPAVQVAGLLQLSNLSRPWMVSAYYIKVI